jgi:hypothetical protein
MGETIGLGRVIIADETRTLQASWNDRHCEEIQEMKSCCGKYFTEQEANMVV